MLLLWIPACLSAENYLINGGQESKIAYQMIQEVKPSGKTATLSLSYVVPESYRSPTYSQRIENFQLHFDPAPSTRNETRDARGNKIIQVAWKNIEQPVIAGLEFTAYNQTLLATLKSTAPYPLTGIPEEHEAYLGSTAQVQSDHPEIRQKAGLLTGGVQTEFDAVQKILSWIIDHMRYVTPPIKYDALYAFQEGKGNCQNYSHLAAALMRSAGIPVRVVNGVTLKEPYTAKLGDGEFTFKMGQGRHSWIEVWFPDLGWVPFDPQQTELFVSNRFIRVEVGIDNEETINDGMVKWRLAKGVSEKPAYREIIDATFEEDNIRLEMVRQDYGPKNMLLSPKIEAAFEPVIVPPPPPPVVVPESDLKKMEFTEEFLFGNLDFPRGVNFAFSHGQAVKGPGDEYQMRKDFLVETAEYATEKMKQFAQVVVLQKPVKLNQVGLAMQKFGGAGQMWIELFSDRGDRPGEQIATSDLISVDQVSEKPGYDWVHFDFSGNPPVLSPGKYWIVLGFTGGPIMNWFYTYGKPVGPVDGTRYKGIYDREWSGALSYEFNYRVSGWTRK